MYPFSEQIRRWLVLSAVAVAVAAAVAQEPAAPVPLTTCAAVKTLPREVAAQKMPVRITGVVSYRESLFHSSNSAFVLHDGAEGVYCTLSPELAQPLADLQLGEKIEVVGVSGPGFTSFVEVTSVKRLGPGTLPPSSLSKLWKLQNGRYDCALIGLEGVVRRMHKDELGGYRLELAEETGTFSAFVPAQEGELPESLVDARLQMEGTCFAIFNPRGECTGVNLRLTSPKHFSVMQRGPEDPFAAPLASSLALNRFRSGPALLHRRRLVGTVMLHRKGEFFYLMSNQRTFRIHTRQQDSLDVGDVVEASGFVERTPNFGILVESVFRINSHAKAPPPQRVPLEELLKGQPPGTYALRGKDYDGALITIQAAFLKADHDAQGWHQLHISHEGVVRHAILGPDVSDREISTLVPGSILDLTGVCELRLTQGWPVLEMPKPSIFKTCRP